MTDETRFARSATPNPFGKCEVELKTHVDEATADAIAALASINGQTKSEYIRALLQAHVHGHFHALKLAARRGGCMPGIGPDDGS